MTYRINTFNGEIHRDDGVVMEPPYVCAEYLDYASWVQQGNAPVEFYEEPPAPVPASVTRFQVQATLDLAGLYDAVDSLMADSGTPMVYKLAWSDATEFRRDSAFFAFLSQSLALSNERIDEIFKEAATLTG